MHTIADLVRGRASDIVNIRGSEKLGGGWIDDGRCFKWRVPTAQAGPSVSSEFALERISTNFPHVRLCLCYDCDIDRVYHPFQCRVKSSCRLLKAVENGILCALDLLNCHLWGTACRHELSGAERGTCSG